jgi:hypothetical protein
MLVTKQIRGIFHDFVLYETDETKRDSITGRKGAELFKRDVLSCLFSTEKFADLRFLALHMRICDLRTEKRKCARPPLHYI